MGITSCSATSYIREKSQINNFNDLTLYQNQFSGRTATSRITASRPPAPMSFLSARASAICPARQDCRRRDRRLAGYGSFTYTSGDYPRFGNLIVNSNPCQNRSVGLYFNPAGFQSDSGKHVCFAHQSDAVLLSCRPEFCQSGCDPAEELPHHREGAGAAEDDGLQCTEQIKLWRPEHEPNAPDFGQALIKARPRASSPARPRLRQPGRTTDRTRPPADVLTCEGGPCRAAAAFARGASAKHLIH